MADILLNLEAQFQKAVRDMLAECRNAGFELRPYMTLRSPDEQARLWRQSRALEEIRAEIDRLRNGGATFLAACIERVGPQAGRHVTNALPGLSWHQWGEAVDCVVIENGKAVWDTKHPGWKAYGEAARRAGLEAGMFWKSFKDFPHVQKRKDASPLSAGLSLADIEKAMRERWGG